MQIQDLIKTYRAKSDEELIQLAAAPEHLTSEARYVLDSELSNRQICTAEPFEAPQDGLERDVVQDITPGKTSRTGDENSVGDFVAEVFRIYHSHFWLFFKITLPAVIIGSIALILGRHEGREIARHLPRGVEILEYRTEVLEIWLVNFLAYLASWLAFSFSFGATCSAVRQDSLGLLPSVRASLVDVRKRPASLLLLSLLLFVLMVIAATVSGLLSAGVFWALHKLQAHPSRLAVYVVSYSSVGIALLILSRFALAIPALVLDDCKVGHAIFRSDELTEGKWSTLAVLLAKSVIGGYLAGVFPFWLASYVGTAMPLPAGFSWMLTAASVVSVTLVEPTMFIGFALLYLKTRTTDFSPSTT